MITVNSNALPIEKLVHIILAHLPLKEDMDEAKYVYPCLVNLFSTHTTLMANHVSAVTIILAQAYGNEQIDSQTKSCMVALLKTFATSGPQFQTFVEGLPDKIKCSALAAIQA